MNKKQNVHSLRCENIDHENFEDILEADLIDIEEYLDSYIVCNVDEEKIDSTIDVLKSYMPKEEVTVLTPRVSILDRLIENIELVKLQFSLISREYFLASLLLVLVGTIAITRLDLSIYLSASIIAPIPMLLGIFEIIKGREESVWELELSYKYSLREIVLSKLIIINIISIVESLMISVALSNTYSAINLFQMISIWLIPVFLMGSISLVITSLYRSINSIALCISIWILGVMSISIYEKIADITTINTFIILGISAAFSIVAMKLFYKKSISSLDFRTLDF